MASEFPPDWKLLPIDSCMAALIDYRGKSPRKVSTGIPLITAKVVKGGRILPPMNTLPRRITTNGCGGAFPRPVTFS
jgi:hypothetical protein